MLTPQKFQTEVVSHTQSTLPGLEKLTPFPTSFRPLDSPSPEKEMGIIRTGSIPNKSSESLKARLHAEGEKPDTDVATKPELKKSPKPDVLKKV